MVELGQLETRHQDFEQKNVHVVVISIEDQEAAKATQEQFPHLIIISDADRKLTEAATMIHPHSAPDGGDTSTPATLLVDDRGVVRWTFRPERVPTRLSPGELLAAIDREMPAK
jgi:alkyl hydroperoxide reductase subunit AhpC